MIIEHGNMWDVYKESDLWLFTANATVTSAGRLVMGAGIAKEVRDKFTNIDLNLGRLTIWHSKPYGMVMTDKAPRGWIGAFQTKDHWRLPSTVELIEYSTKKLLQWCATNTTARVDLNYPGIGKGGLSRDDVEPIISVLPNNVYVWIK